MNEKFEKKLRLFGNRVGIICALESGGKITEEEAFDRIKKLYKKLKKLKRKIKAENEEAGSQGHKPST